MRRISPVLLPAAAILLVAGSAMAQTGAAPAAPAPAVTPAPAPQRSTGIPQRDTLIRMTRPVTIEFKEHRLEDVIKFIGEVTSAAWSPALQRPIAMAYVHRDFVTPGTRVTVDGADAEVVALPFRSSANL